MKLNVKRTILVGFAFLSISAFWQMYDNKIPLILQNTFGLNETITGTIMAADNILALFLLPFFGGLSDRCKTRMGKRKPFILTGTILAVALMIFLPIIDNKYAAAPAAFLPILFIVILALTLIAMGTYRSPAVALMPDVTPKPLRSKANAIINLMGTAGGIIVLVLGMVFGTGKAANALMSYTTFFLVTAGVMVAALVIFTLCVKEPKWASEADEINAKEENTADSDGSGDKKLSRGELTSLLFILLSVVFWFMGYNAVTSKYSVYAGSVLNLDYNLTLIVAQAAAIVSYIPVGIVASKIGRKKTIIAGVIMLGVAFGAASFMRSGSNIWVMNALFALAGVGWATINVNSYPMVVELARGGNVGRYTGFYYTASMSAQIITPVLSGAFLTNVGMTTLFPYAAIFVAFAFVTMQFVKHGDSKPVQKKDMLENLDIDD